MFIILRQCQTACNIILKNLHDYANLTDHTCLSPDRIMELLCFSLEHTYIQGSPEEIFRQSHGCAMGKPTSPIIADLYMTGFELKALAAFPLKPKLYARYVDDILIIWPHGKDSALQLLEHFNSICIDIQFTAEFEENGSLPYLDILLSHNQTSPRGFHTSVYRKNLDLSHFIPFKSFHCMQHKLASLKTFTHRAQRYCSDTTLLQQELNTLRTIFQNNGFPKAVIEKTINGIIHPVYGPWLPRPKDQFRLSLPYLGPPTEKIRRLLSEIDIKVVYGNPSTIFKNIPTPKVPMPLQHSSGLVYAIPCSCKKLYIGQTGREFDTRLQEHKAQFRNKSNTSAFNKHFAHQPKFEDAFIVCREPQITTREYKEAFIIMSSAADVINDITDTVGRSLGTVGLNNSRGRILSESWYRLVPKLPKVGNKTTQNQLEP